MYLQRLKSLMSARALRAVDVARAAQVSRAAVCKWLRQRDPPDWVNVETSTLRTLAHSVGIAPAYFLEPLPLIQHMHTLFLWDALYPSMENLAMALLRREPEAIARLVQVVGLHDARRVAGDVVLRRFPRYRPFLHPERRKQMDIIWPLYQSGN